MMSTPYAPLSRLEAEEARRKEGDQKRIAEIAAEAQTRQAGEGAAQASIDALTARVAALEAAAAAEPEPVPVPPTDELLFASDFTSWDGWYLQGMPGRATLVNGWARFEVRPGDKDPDTGKNRCEVSGPDFKEGEDLWVRNAFRRALDDESVPNDWLLTQQLHEDEWSGSPANGVLYTKDWSGRLGNAISYCPLPVLPKGATQDLLYRIKLSQGTNGEVEPFLNGAALPVYKGKTLLSVSAYLKVGIYRASISSGTSVIEHDSIKVGTSRASVGG